MRSTDILADSLSRIAENVHGVLDGIDADGLVWRPENHGNSVAWLIWHLTRVQDSHIADLAGTEQVWIVDGWVDRFGLDLPAGHTGYAHSSDDVAKVDVRDRELLRGYHDATHAATLRYLEGLSDADLDEVIDENWDPPVRRGVRLVSLVDDDAQHVGQAAFVAGLR
ncbi:mycothiol transferase [Gordonia soli]|uniref:DinB-like domain-containing protein n=1 Tax=Gordonia soli NBRC 108243 TaxID=1223545 RepID=M0QJ01_9ACTN|nr:DinB family protein [Gordonia soli]GAC68538.1 hypothetical protein GS4_16_00680 [Gordonia soli NBRC 108243]